MDEEYQRMAANSIAHEAFCAGQAWQQAAAAQERPCVLWKPRLFIDGSQWCALFGENIQEGVVGFGDSPDEAMWAFDAAWRKKLESPPVAQPTPSVAEQDQINAEAAIRSIYGAQPASDDEYVGWYCAHCQRGVDASEVTYHEQHEACGCVISDDRPPKSAPSIPEGWLRAIDEALVVAHIGVANASDTYEEAKAKLDSLIGFHVDVATDPAVNGGWKLVPIEPTQEMREAGVFAGSNYYDIAEATYEAMLEAAPESKL